MAEMIDFLGLKILRADQLKEAVDYSPMGKVDLVEIAEKVESGFWRPLKVSWRLKLDRRPILEQIRSRRARKQIKADQKKLSGKQIEIRTAFPLETPIFKQWLDLYQQEIGAKKRGRQVIDSNWLKEKEKKGKKVGAVLAVKKEELIGGNLFLEVGHHLSVAYGVAQKVEGLFGGLSLLLDFESLNFAQAHGYQEVSLGQDTNLYGFHLSSGLFFYKAKLGFQPVAAPKTEWRTTYFLNFEKFTEPVMFFSSQEKLVLNYLSSEVIRSEDIYLPLGVETCQTFLKEWILPEHRRIFSQGGELKKRL